MDASCFFRATEEDTCISVTCPNYKHIFDTFFFTIITDLTSSSFYFVQDKNHLLNYIAGLLFKIQSQDE